MTAMSDRGVQLHQIADQQLTELIDLISTRDEAALALQCSGRGKLGDGTVAACASHTADNYLRIAAFLSGAELASSSPHSGKHRHWRGFALLRSRSHQRPNGHGAVPGADEVDRCDLLRRLATGRDALNVIAGLRDEQLDAIPPASEMKFCDGKRTLQDVIASLLNHQSHQLDAIKSALASAPQTGRQAD